MSNRHYASSDLVNWLRKKVFKIDKPTALGWGEWAKWDAKLKKERPVAFFFTEALPEAIEWIPDHTIDYINEVRYFVSNYVSGTHRLNSTLSKGKWHEMSERILYANFDTYVDYIEIEEAYHHIAWRDKEDQKKYNIPWYKRARWFRWFNTWRCPQAGIDHLLWEMTLDQHDPNDPNSGPNGISPHQAKSAREKMELYTWWKHVRPTRGDSWEVSGLRTFWDAMDAKYKDEDDGFNSWLGLGGKGKMTAAESRQYSALSKVKDELEEQWAKEDTEMLIRLMKIRESLWT